MRELSSYGVGQLAPQGVFYLAGDKQQEMARYEEMVSGFVRNVQVLANNGQYRVVSAQASDLRRGNVSTFER